MNIVSVQFSLIFRPKSGEDQKKKKKKKGKRSSLKISPIFRPKLGEDQKKRPKLKLNWIFLGAGQKQAFSPTIC